MAFVTRAMRFTQEQEEAEVGPGSYVHADFFPGEARVCSFLLDGRARPRRGGGRAKANPGPDCYSSLEREEDGWERSKRDASSNTFVSKTIRFGREAKGSRKGVALSPGPGTYSESNKWIKKTHKYTAAPTARRVTFQKVPTAPSVPARNQSNGYEEGSNGELLMQPAAEGGFTGVSSDTVGPAGYNPDFNSVSNTRYTDFGKNSGTRTIFQEQSAPGPGQYNAAPYVGTGEPHPKEITKTSNFASKVPWMKDKESEVKESPGPGSYAFGDQFKQKPKVSQVQSGFGSRSLRDIDKKHDKKQIDIAKAPGPGAYEERRTFSTGMRSEADSAAFTSTTERFNSGGSKMPGPGSYMGGNTTGFIEEIDKKLTSTNGILGSSTPRFASHKSKSSYMYLGNDETPGPGNYWEKSFFKVPRKARKPQAVFVSMSSRLGKDPKDEGDEKGRGKREAFAVPPPGAYEVEVKWLQTKYRFQNKGTGSFASSSMRFQAASAAGENDETPGPGNYRPENVNLDKKPVNFRTCFVSSERRFKPSSTLSPGPGTYDSDDNTGSMLKRSYNVTIDGVNY